MMMMITLRQKLDNEEVNYKRLYEDLLSMYKELELKCKSLEENNVGLKEKIRSLEKFLGRIKT